jgi:hypothetical protein
VSAPFPDEIPADAARTCVFCGAIAIPGGPSGPGEVVWLVNMAMDPNHEHETLTGNCPSACVRSEQPDRRRSAMADYPAALMSFIRARLDDWDDVPAACEPAIALMGGSPGLASIAVSNPFGRVLWTSNELASTARALRVIVDMCEPALARPKGHPDRAWADATIGTLALIWAEHPAFPKPVTV